ncbi:ethylene-responsive transcription factor ERF014-like [Vicia villosa]|uniref:ethylene-responsive transcription factor ERF014-like n=1 Tax=Vicia villosa TaxID=3911 RepID=UPI00273A77B5|nr:ethylene-responsive transcription factor ERF014-like [Vicia villosa]
MVKSQNINKIKQEPLTKTKPIVISDNSKKKKYKGVRMRSWGSWVSEIRAPNQKTRIWLGSYSTPEAAARAYDAALLCLKGSSSASNLNFPLTTTSSSNCIIPQDMSPKSIQRVAAAAANNLNLNVNVESNTPSSSSSMASSSSSSDEVSIMSSFDQANDEMKNMMESNWYGLEGLESPKYVDQMMMSASFVDFGYSSYLFDDVYEESDIRLWNFS